MDWSVYITAGTGWKPTAGPPVRIWMSTPVSRPWATSGPVTRFLSVSTLYPAPTRLYRKPCSDSGCQSFCTTIGSGQTPFRSSGSPVPAAGAGVPLSVSPLVHAEPTSATTRAAASTTSLLLFMVLLAPFDPGRNGHSSWYAGYEEVGSRADWCQLPTTLRARKPKNQNTTTPNNDDRMIAENICSDCSRER